MLCPWFPSPCMYSLWRVATHGLFALLLDLKEVHTSNMNHNLNCTLYSNMKSLKTFSRSLKFLPPSHHLSTRSNTGALLKLLWQKTWKGRTRNFSRFATEFSSRFDPLWEIMKLSSSRNGNAWLTETRYRAHFTIHLWSVSDYTSLVIDLLKGKWGKWNPRQHWHRKPRNL